METVGEWLKPIIGMIILAGFFEVILPDNQLKGVTKMILGLVIMLFLMRPLTRILNVPALIAGSMPRLSGEQMTVSDTGRIIREGERLRGGWYKENRAQAEQELRDNLEQVVGLFDGVELQKVDCQFKASGLERVKVRVKAAPRLRVGSKTQESVTRKLNRAVQLFTRLNQDQIEICWGDQK